MFGLRSGPDGSAQAVGFIWSLFRAKRSILDPIRTIFDDLGPNRHCGPDLDLQDQAGDGPLEWVRPIPKAPERSWHASGPSFRPNRRFSTHFGPNLMFLAPTGTLVSQDLGLAWLWTSPIAAGKPDPLSETSTSVLSQQQTSVLSQQQTSVLSQQQTSVLSQQKTSILSQHRTSQQLAGGRQLSRLLLR